MIDFICDIKGVDIRLSCKEMKIRSETAFMLKLS